MIRINHKIVMLLVTGLLALPMTSSAEVASISGSQKSGGVGFQAELHCNTVTLRQSSTITKVDGYNGGFWITQSGGLYRQFDQNSVNTAIGLVLPPGDYCAFPNIKWERRDSPNVIYGVDISVE